MSITLSAPAKINLMLDITGKRADGYHTLTTIMQSISLTDIITIIDNNEGVITVNSDNNIIPLNQDNIAYKAAEKFLNYTNIKNTGLNINIQKRIPSEAGLGGGSADAAAVLVGLNHMFKTHLSVEQLCNIGVSVGADVPFSIIGGTKICEGIGEIMQATFPLEECYIVIAKGNAGISTKTAFEKIDLLGLPFNPVNVGYDGSINSLKLSGYNKFELVTDNSEINTIKDIMLSMNADYSAMSGSGSAVFGLFLNKETAEKCADELSNLCIFVDLCKPVSNGVTIL